MLYTPVEYMGDTLAHHVRFFQAYIQISSVVADVDWDTARLENLAYTLF
jgi:hypothetical protein